MSLLRWLLCLGTVHPSHCPGASLSAEGAASLLETRQEDSPSQAIPSLGSGKTQASSSTKSPSHSPWLLEHDGVTSSMPFFTCPIPRQHGHSSQQFPEKTGSPGSWRRGAEPSWLIWPISLPSSRQLLSFLQTRLGVKSHLSVPPPLLRRK